MVRPPGMYNLHPGGGPMNPPLVPPLPPVSAASTKPKGRRTSAAGKVKKVKAEKVPRKLLQQQHQLSWQQHVAQVVRQDTIFWILSAAFMAVVCYREKFRGDIIRLWLTASSSQQQLVLWPPSSRFTQWCLLQGKSQLHHQANLPKLTPHPLKDSYRIK